MGSIQSLAQKFPYKKKILVFVEKKTNNNMII